jgi:succinate dehydrogenase / fumarate reductase cytochrome b subunit
MGQTNRPLSPHLSVYRWQIGNTLSIVHRLTGIVLSLSAVALTAWLVGIASGPDAYSGVVAALRSPPGVLVGVGGSFCFFFHLCNGIRHLFWDAGYGFEIPRARATGIGAVTVAVLLTLLFWGLALGAGASS